MPRRIVFLGNCQIGSICTLYERFVAGVTHDEATFLPSWTNLDSGGQAVLAAADVVVEQVASFAAQPDISGLRSSVRRIPVPLVAGTFLWPFAGGAHPANEPAAYLPEGPFPGEIGDSFLARMVTEGVSAEAALAQYSAHDLGGAAGLNRRYEIIMEQQRRRDEISEFSIAPLIEQHFRSEHLFLSPHHPGLRLTLALAAQLFFRLGAPARNIELLTTKLRRAPFPLDELPIHPRVAAHFNLSYAPSGRTYEWRGEGRFTWDEWVLRYMRCTWLPDMHRAWAIAAANPAEARALLEPVLAAAPEAPTARAAMAKAQLGLREPEPAAEHIAEAIRILPQVAEYHRLAGMIAAARGQLAEAEAHGRAALVWDPGDIGGYLALAKVQDDRGDPAGAEATRREALELQPDDATLITDLGTSLLNQKRHEEAVAQYRRALSINPAHAGAWFGTSLALGHLGHTEEAVEAVRKAIQHRPGIGAYHSQLGHLLVRAGRQDEALTAFQDALAIEPNNAGLHSLVADLLRKEQATVEALYHARRAADSEPRSYRHQIRLAQLLARDMRVAEAIQHYRKLLAMLPTQLQLTLELAQLYGRLDRLDEALSVLDAAVESNPAEARPALDRAALLLRMGRAADASASLRLAAETGAGGEAAAALRSEVEKVAAGGLLPVPARYLAVESQEIFPALERVMPACIRFTNFPEVNPSFGGHHVDNLYVEKLRWLPAVSLCRLPDTTMLMVPNGEEFIPVCGGRVAAEQARQHWGANEFSKVSAACMTRDVIEEPAVLIGRYGIRTWGHWLGELLPKVVAVEARWPQRFRYVVPDRMVTDPVHATALQSLAYYGIGPERLRLVASGCQLACRDLHVVTSAWSAERLLHPMAAELMRGQGGGAAQGEREPAAGWLNVALLRRSTRSRRIANLPAVERTLVERGFTVVDIEALTFRQQVDLFRNANAVAAVLGSGLSGLVYAPRGVKVLTMAPATWGDLFFFAMMQERDAAFAEVRGPTLAGEGEDAAVAPFVVPMEALDKALVSIGFPRAVSGAFSSVEPAKLAQAG